MTASLFTTVRPRLDRLRVLLAALVCAAPAAMPASALAGANDSNVDLSTLPPREGVQLTIYNSEDLTLVRETRRITVHEGVNPLQFSWANTLIDPTSVDIRFRSHPKDLHVIDTVFPHDKPQMLYWNVRSAFEGEALVEISYFTSGISWSADYVCIADPDEEAMSFEGYVRVTNNSGADYDDAQVRMVVGTINLVDKIADLARRGIVPQSVVHEVQLGERLRGVTKESRRDIYLAMEADMAAPGRAGGGIAPSAPPEIIKEGLSEYFIYTVEGEQTVPNNWSKRLQLFTGRDITFDIVYRFRPEEYGHFLNRLYIVRNDEEHELGHTPLPDGVVRLFRDNGRDGLAFLTADHTNYVPIGQEIELELGADPEVIHEHVHLDTNRGDFVFQRNGTRTFVRPDKGEVVRNNDTVAGWNETYSYIERIRNYRAKPITVEIRRPFAGDVSVVTEAEASLHDYRTVEFNTTVEPGETAEIPYDLVIRFGENQKQNRVELKKPE